jgi:hypothetical protein
MSDLSHLREQLIGSWKLVKFVSEPVNGTEPCNYFPFGRGAQGFIIYTSDGHMSVHLMRPGAPRCTSAGFLEGSKDKLALAMKHYLAYAGPFDVRETDGGALLRHHILVSSYPDWLGTVQERRALLEGDVLRLETVNILEKEVSFDSRSSLYRLHGV